MDKTITDLKMIEELRGFKSYVRTERNKLNKKGIKADFQHPLDEKVLGDKGLLENLKKLMMDDSSIGYTAADQMDELWRVLLEKSVICLRFFDKRESFMVQQKPEIVAYGMNDLVEYHHRYTDFEGLMYGANSRYRDHVFHVVRVWMLGVYVLVRQLSVDGSKKKDYFFEHIGLDGGSQLPGELNFFEKISMWTIISLCHDLGYPLEKADQILSKTRNMMRDFIPNPNVWSDFGYSGVQNSINEYMLRFISTKMVKCDAQGEEPDAWRYKGRVQPKYYLKFAKSLESFQHGVISSVIIFKLLVYFLEADFNLNDDHTYSAEDARQFYIRREMLRSIAAHTCPDAYNIHITTFSSLLFLCDELQEWGRKSWNELYTGFSKKSVHLKLEHFAHDGIRFTETIETEDAQDKAVIDHIIRVFKRQYALYKSVFRDGQEGADRDFSLTKTMNFVMKSKGSEKYVTVEFTLPSAQERNENGMVSRFKIDLSKLPDEETKKFNNSLKQLKSQLYGGEIKINGIKKK